MSIDWKKVRDELVPPVSENDPVLAKIYAELRWLDTSDAQEGNDPITGRSWAEIGTELRQSLHDEIERYRWRKAGFELTPEILEACR
jgi:hypothetical protein